MKFEKFRQILDSHYGNLHWWPADTEEEVVIGAILTQNTSWKNVEKAMENLKQAHILTLNDIVNADRERIRNAIRPSGFYNQKTERLINISGKIVEKGGLRALREMTDRELSYFLGSLKGVGKETEESIMIYALGRKRFVVDKYTLRIFNRTGLIEDDTDFPKSLKNEIERKLSLEELNNLHGQIVNLGKDFCRTQPICKKCPLAGECDYEKEITLP